MGSPWALYSVRELANVSFNFFNLCISHGRLDSLITREKQRRREFVGEIATLGKYLKAEVSHIYSAAHIGSYGFKSARSLPWPC